MNFIKTSKGLLLRGAIYRAQIVEAEVPYVLFSFDGRDFSKLPLISTLDTIEKKEKLTQPKICSVTNEGDGMRVELTATSNIWAAHRFIWKFEKKRASYYHEVEGTGDLARCCFFSSGRPIAYDQADSDGYDSNASFMVPRYHTFNPNLANITEFDISQPSFAGVGNGEHPYTREYLLLQTSHLYTPGPLFLAFHEGEATLGIGIGTKPGEYRFDGLEYTGFTASAAAFYVQYLGYTRVEKAFTTPEAVLVFGYGPFSCLEDYIAWIDERGYGTNFQFAEAPWHREPIFCGWAEQCASCAPGSTPGAGATQENYEAWIEELDSRGIPYGTIVIDDKWQKYYGTFEVDTEKWPDLPGFVKRQHEKGHHVLLWIPCYHKEGVPEELCAKNSNGEALFPVPGLEAYDTFLREKILRLVRETDIDGFKEDWIGRSAEEPHMENYGNLHGIELVRRFQSIVYNTLHEIKPDGLMETQTPNPLFRESSDMLRLNDSWFGVRNMTEMMRERARIARIVGWDVLDCDDAAPTTLKEWMAYMQVQPDFGVPSLYFLYKTSCSHEESTSAQSDYIRSLWQDYIKENGLDISMG